MLRKYKLQKQFRTEISEQGAMDIEDLVLLRGSMKTCPYYGSRSVVPTADLVVLPYQSLLSKSSRESLGLNLKNNIVIIDEAHNLVDSLLSVYDSIITLLQLGNVQYHMEKYFEKFCNLLGPGNRRYIQTLMVLCRAFLKSLCNETDASYTDQSEDIEKASKANFASMDINDFLFSFNVDNINLIKLLQYLKESNIMHEVSAYGDNMSSLQNSLAPIGAVACGEDGSTLSGFRALSDILLSLKNKDGDGRIIISRSWPTSSGHQGGYLKYVMLTGEKISLSTCCGFGWGNSTTYRGNKGTTFPTVVTGPVAFFFFHVITWYLRRAFCQLQFLVAPLVNLLILAIALEVHRKW